MKKKRVITKVRDKSVVIYSSEKIRVNKELNGELFFEIERELTTDLAEAIAIIISKGIKDENFWQLEFECDVQNISPDKTLYWLSGGDNEWIEKNHYQKSWAEVYLDFQTQFGVLIIDIINNSKTFSDIKMGFVKNLNLQTLYEFSLEKGYL